ncbi:CapA family protein [Kallotenue papyrolyticum]|uniref:CapA family protein n=1 Tax=Kallotenue papyrolyticum TaxID=1325125 RepID=UPI000492619D|nr:CapA family protein [Kallotenue papyrolyticum]
MRIALTGDVMLGRLVDRYVLANASLPATYVWGDLLPVLLNADLRLINLECVISTRGTPWRPESKPFHFRARPRAIDALNAARIDLTALANNHTLDYGVEALRECLQLLDQAGIAHVGAGANLAAAMRPALLTAAAQRVAVVAITDNEPDWQATPDRPGTFYVAYNRRGPLEPYRTRLRQALDLARRAADLVIVSAHVGPNWGPPSPGMQALARTVIELGADVYWGHSNHTPLGIQWYHGRPILYATGDFIDDYAVDPVERNDLSFLFELEVADARVQAIRLYPTAIAHFQARRAEDADARWLIERMRQRSAAWATPIVACADGTALSYPPA